MTDAPVLEAEGLTKRYGKVQALDGLDLVAHSGKMVAILGPNGAGKTTFMRSVATLVRPDTGSLRVGGIDVLKHPNQVRRLIGLAGQYAAVEEAMTGRENLVMVARLFGHDRRTSRRNADAVLEQMRLTQAGNRLVRTYSGGMRRRLDLGASLVGAPGLLLLDEPTTGLDPRSRLELWELIRSLVSSGTNALLTTQYLDEADYLAAEIVIIDHGKVIAQGTPTELKSRVGRDVIQVHACHVDDLPFLARALEPLGSGPARIDVGTRRLTIPADEGMVAMRQALRVLDEECFGVDDIALRRPTLNEVFLTLTDSGIDDQAAPDASTAATPPAPAAPTMAPFPTAPPAPGPGHNGTNGGGLWDDDDEEEPPHERVIDWHGPTEQPTGWTAPAGNGGAGSASEAEEALIAEARRNLRRPTLPPDVSPTATYHPPAPSAHPYSPSRLEVS